MKLKTIKARQIFDSRGWPTVECDVTLDDGSFGRAAVPSGASTGSGEALELRDGGSKYAGKGVSKAAANVNEVIAPALIGQDASNQQVIDQKMFELDGTENKSKLGANAILAVSLAVAKAAAASQNKPLYEYVGEMVGNTRFNLPMPMLNILNGGKHADGSTDIQEFMIMPIGAKTFAEALEIASDVFHTLGKVLKSYGYSTTVGDEGGYAPSVRGGTEEALNLISHAIEVAGYKLGKDVALAVDVAASELVKNDDYNFSREGKHFTSDSLIDFYKQLTKQYPMVSIEDGLSETDWAGWQKLNSVIGSKVQLVGDDLLVTNPGLLEKAIKEKSANAILIKPNQIGSLSETIQTVNMAHAAGWNTVMSHRSGETEDTTIAHLAVGLGCSQIKTGSFSRSERIAKYNELLRIQENLPEANFSHPFKSKD